MVNNSYGDKVLRLFDYFKRLEDQCKYIQDNPINMCSITSRNADNHKCPRNKYFNITRRYSIGTIDSVFPDSFLLNTYKEVSTINKSSTIYKSSPRS